MWNWFDPESWYPLGRIVGSTLYPGLMATSGLIYWILEKISFPTDIKHICVFLAPVFSAFTSIVAYLFTKEITNKPFAGLYSALFMAIVPGYIQRSVAGSYDNEAVAIFALIFTFYLYIKAVNTVIYIKLGFYYVECIISSRIFLYGSKLGRICFYYQYYTYFQPLFNIGR